MKLSTFKKSIPRLRTMVSTACGATVLIAGFQNCGQASFISASSPPVTVTVASLQAQDCVFNGQTVYTDTSITAFQNSSVLKGSACVSESRTCTGGSLTGSYAFASCAVGSTASCLFNGLTIADGQSVQAYANSTNPTTCVPQTRTCQNGSLTGSYQFSSCTVQSSASQKSCQFNGTQVASGSGILAYQQSSVGVGQSCVTQARVCTDGALSGSYTFASCSVAGAQSCLFNGQQVADGQSVMAYKASSVAVGQACSGEVRVCSKGTLSGSNQFSSCSTAAAANCLFRGQELASGQNIVSYMQDHVYAGQSCTKGMTSCSNGQLSGGTNFRNCSVGLEPADVAGSCQPQDCDVMVSTASDLANIPASGFTPLAVGSFPRNLNYCLKNSIDFQNQTFVAKNHIISMLNLNGCGFGLQNFSLSRHALFKGWTNGDLKNLSLTGFTADVTVGSHAANWDDGDANTNGAFAVFSDTLNNATLSNITISTQNAIHVKSTLRYPRQTLCGLMAANTVNVNIDNLVIQVPSVEMDYCTHGGLLFGGTIPLDDGVSPDIKMSNITIDVPQFKARAGGMIGGAIGWMSASRTLHPTLTFNSVSVHSNITAGDAVANEEECNGSCYAVGGLIGVLVPLGTPVVDPFDLHFSGSIRTKGVVPQTPLIWLDLVHSEGGVGGIVGDIPIHPMPLSASTSLMGMSVDATIEVEDSAYTRKNLPNQISAGKFLGAAHLSAPFSFPDGTFSGSVGVNGQPVTNPIGADQLGAKDCVVGSLTIPWGRTVDLFLGPSVSSENKTACSALGRLACYSNSLGSVAELVILKGTIDTSLFDPSTPDMTNIINSNIVNGGMGPAVPGQPRLYGTWLNSKYGSSKRREILSWVVQNRQTTCK